MSAAIAMGADVIETDLRRTAQGRLVLAHDPLSQEPSPDLVELADLVALAQGRIRLDIELKEAGLRAGGAGCADAAAARGCWSARSCRRWWRRCGRSMRPCARG